MRTAKQTPTEDIALEHLFHALSDPLRLEIVRQLARDGEASCQALECGRPKSSMSHHFRVLRESGLIQTRIEGVTRWNALRRDDLERRFPGLLDSVIAAMAA